MITTFERVEFGVSATCFVYAYYECQCVVFEDGSMIEIGRRFLYDTRELINY